MEIYNLKDKKEYLEEVAILEHNEWAKNKEDNYQERIKRKIAKINSLFEEKNFVKLILLDSKELIGFISIFPNDASAIIANKPAAWLPASASLPVAFAELHMRHLRVWQPF